MSDLPPKTLKTQLVRLDHNLKQIERSHYAGIQRAPGSLPVLEAFQEFLDNERRVARRRLVGLTLFFLLILLMAGGGGVALVTIQMKRMAVDYDNVVAKTDALQSAETSTLASLTALESRIEVNDQLLTKQNEERLSTHQDVEARMEAERARIAEMESILENLATENTALKTDLDRVMQKWPSVTQQLQELAEFDSKKRPRGKKEKAESVALKRPDEEPPPPQTLSLTIVPPGDSLGMRWRLPTIQE